MDIYTDVYVPTYTYIHLNTHTHTYTHICVEEDVYKDGNPKEHVGIVGALH